MSEWRKKQKKQKRKLNETSWAKRKERFWARYKLKPLHRHLPHAHTQTQSHNDTHTITRTHTDVEKRRRKSTKNVDQETK